LPLLDAPPVQEPDETVEEIADKTTPER
jgi:hypothetical protein